MCGKNDVITNMIYFLSYSYAQQLPISVPMQQDIVSSDYSQNAHCNVLEDSFAHFIFLYFESI